MTYTILILTSDAGFGHRRAAQALEAGFLETVGEQVVVEVRNPLDDPDLPSLLRSIETGYDEIVVDDPTLYQIAYAATDAPVVAQLMQRVSTTVLNRTLTKWVRELQPDAVITTYPVYTQAIIQAIRKAKLSAPVDVVVTDLIGVHSVWFHQDADLTFVPTQHVQRQAQDQGLRAERVYLSGLPVHPRFAYLKQRDRREVRAELGWDPDLTTALIVGSSRSRQTANIARLLDRAGLPLQSAAVAGGDAEVTEELQRTQWKGRVHTYGLVDNMAEMMRAADFIICKAGGLIVSESLASGLPMILYEALPGQEVGNVRYVVECGAGKWSPGVIGALTTVYAWLGDKSDELAQCAAAAERVGRPRAVFDIVEQVMQQIGRSEKHHNSG
ncbi:MAG: galactosyldiacylglycerol synthase [Chloroflexi bacterium]|nr:galactosyldiacylglycerol synthase [Chloroflexota bacterium]